MNIHDCTVLNIVVYEFWSILILYCADSTVESCKIMKPVHKRLTKHLFRHLERKPSIHISGQDVTEMLPHRPCLRLALGNIHLLEAVEQSANAAEKHAWSNTPQRWYEYGHHNPVIFHLQTPHEYSRVRNWRHPKYSKYHCSSPPSAGATSCSFPLAKAFFQRLRFHCQWAKGFFASSHHFPSVPCWSPLHSFPFKVYVWGSTSYNQVRSTVSHASSADTSTLAYFNSCHDATTHEGAKVGGSMMYDGGSCWILWNPTFNSQNAHTLDRWLFGHITLQAWRLDPCWPMLTPLWAIPIAS